MSYVETKKNIKSDFKIIVIGGAGVGKTSFVNRWNKNIFLDDYKSTIVSEFKFKILELNGKIYRIQLWDLAGTLIIICRSGFKYYYNKNIF